MYDKCGIVLRIETTTNDVSFFKHHRKVKHRNGPPTRALAPVKKSIYSLIDLREILLGCNRRYLAHLSALDDFAAGVRALERLTKPRKIEKKTIKGINFFERGASALLHALQNPRVNIAGARSADILPSLGMFSPNQAVAATAPTARHRRDQACQRDVPLLSDQGRPCRDRSSRPRHSSYHHSGIDLMGFFDAERVKRQVVSD
jgi:hypothetical protein